MSDDQPLDRTHLLSHAQALFPGTTIIVVYDPNDIIHMSGRRYTFEIGSDDDEYIFTDGLTTFTIPLMDFDEDF